MDRASLKPRRDADATRTLAWIAMRMPNWPTINENVAPMMKAMARPIEMNSCALAPNSLMAASVGGTMNTLKNMTNVSTAMSGKIVRNWRLR